MSAIAVPPSRADVARSGVVDMTLVPGRQATARERRRMAELIFSTSYLEYCSAANDLGLPCVELQQRQNIDPYLDQIRVMRTVDARFAGFFSAATPLEFASVQTTCHYRVEMRELDAAYESFVSGHIRPSDYFVASLAVEPRERGRGLFHQAFAEIIASAQRAGSDRVVLTVWDTSAALGLYLAKGMHRVALFDAAWPLFFDRLHLLALPLPQTNPHSGDFS
jgi:GNAT superfamily N-acetyltransferase